MPTQENMALVRRSFQAPAEADLDAMEEMMAPGFISHPLLEPRAPLRQERYSNGSTRRWCPHPTQHVRHLLLRRARPQERNLEILCRPPEFGLFTSTYGVGVRPSPCAAIS